MPNVEPFLSYIKPAIRGMKAYHLEEKSYQIKLNQNESPFDFPSPLKDRILTAFKAMAWNRYPAFGNTALVDKLAQYLGVESSQILVGNGSNELLQTLVQATLFAGKRVLLVQPTFSIYEQLARVAGAEIVSLTFADDWSFPVDEIAGYVADRDIDLCILCSPNSPTGVELVTEDLERILRLAKGLVLLDEAYHEFTDKNHLHQLQCFPNLLITRTFSKAIGLAGLRIGYLVGYPDIVSELKKAKLPYNLDLFSELVAQVVMDDPSFIVERVLALHREKEHLYSELKQHPALEVFPSAANFLMLETPGEPHVLFSKLAGRGILIRDISGHHPRLRNMLRISVGTPEENHALLTALFDVLPGAKRQ